LLNSPNNTVSQIKRLNHNTQVLAVVNWKLDIVMVYARRILLGGFTIYLRMAFASVLDWRHMWSGGEPLTFGTLSKAMFRASSPSWLATCPSDLGFGPGKYRTGGDALTAS
jgi:hypothetical protein